MMKRLFLILLLLMLLSAQAVAFSINIDPPSIYTKASPGEKVTSRITVTNTSDESVFVKIYAQDWKYKDDMSKLFVDFGSTSYSLKDSLTLYVNELTIPGHESRDVIFDIRSLPNQKGGLYGVIFFEAEPVRINIVNTVHLIGRIGTIIYHQVQSTEKYSFDVILKKIEYQDNKTLLTFDLLNQSNTLIDLNGSLMVMTSGKKVVDRVAVRAKALPNQKQSFSVLVNTDLSKQKYSGLFTLSYSDIQEAFTKYFNLYQ